MRKTVALVLALAQIAFGGFLIANGGKAEKSKKEKINEILENGTEYLFDLNSFSYNREERYADPVSFEIRLSASDVSFQYFPVTGETNGVAVFGDSVETPDTDLYYAPVYGETYCVISEETLQTVFAGQEAEEHHYNRNWLQPKKNRFNLGGRWVSVYAVGRLWRGDIVFTGLVVDGVRY